jgi:hypothetical protein
MSYFPPDLPEYNHLRHLQLFVWEPRKPLTEKDLSYHVAHINSRGKPDAWFFDSFLALSPVAPSGGSFVCDVNRGTTRCGDGDFFAIPVPNPANADDWREGLDSMFAHEGLLPALDRTIAGLKPNLGAPPHTRNVVLTIPYPQPTQTMFGAPRRGKPPMNFSVTGQNLAQATEQRLEACKWFVGEALDRWRKARLGNLNLLGFYWIYESLHYAWHVDDHWLLKELYRHLRAKRTRLFWIPFYSSYNVRVLNDYRGFYFDCAFLQPNHMFYHHHRDVKTAAREAADCGAGVEMEYYLNMDPRCSIGREKHRRFRNYLNGGIDYGYMTQSACAWFIGANDLQKIAIAPDARERAFYHDIFHFVKGDYEAK